MLDDAAHSEFSIEDISESVNILFECGHGGAIFFPHDMEFKAPPPDSPHAGRLVLVTAKTGSIRVKPDLKRHVVFLLPVKEATEGDDKQLLIRIPVGVHLFKVRVPGGFFFYYETADGYNVLPHVIANGTDPDQTKKELLLLASPVPPRDARLATHPPSFKEITVAGLNVRREQDGLPPFLK